jgi:phosphate transport system substrate-binding protein
MTQKKETTILLMALLVTGGILGGGFWLFSRQSQPITPNQSTNPASNASPSLLPPPPAPMDVSALPAPTQVPQGTVVKINGSTSMVGINETLKKLFQTTFPGTQVLTNAQGSDKGILELMTGVIDVAGISRPLSSQEQAQGLAAVPMGRDAIAVVVSLENPFRQGLSQQQVREIFQGKITNWSVIGGKPSSIRVINRPPISGTYQAFQKLVLQDQPFGQGANFKTLERDATTPILNALGKNGISYATYSQVGKQKTVRAVAIDNLTPDAANYPYVRELYYAYKNPPTPQVKAFLGFATSPQGQAAIAGIE